jgi:hypothetical protein
VRVQLGFVVAAFLCAMIAVPFFYNHRMNDAVFTGGFLAFVGTPLIAGILQTQTHRPVTLVAAGLLLFCPVVYSITDPLAVEFEKLRDGYFLGTGTAIIFVSTVWLITSYRIRKGIQAFAAGLSLASALVAVFILLWIVMYLE